MKRNTGKIVLALLALFASNCIAAASEAVDLLPDILVEQEYLFDNEIVSYIDSGRVHIRLSNGTANIGDGKLFLRGLDTVNADSTRTVMQRIFRSDSTWFEREAGRFLLHPTHGHIHFENWAIYRIRKYLPGEGVGDIVTEGRKTSFCLTDLFLYDSTIPNANPLGEFFNCESEIQGISVGWIDIYSKQLIDQWIDITDVPGGLYWLESEVDPDHLLLEKDTANNIARIPINLCINDVTVVPDRMRIESIVFAPVSSIALQVYATNTSVLTNGMTIAFTLNGPAIFQIDSASTAGLRTSAFRTDLVAIDPFTSSAAFVILPPQDSSFFFLAPGSGPVLTIYFTVLDSANTTPVSVEFATTGGYGSEISVPCGAYTPPILINGSLAIYCCSLPGDADSGGDVDVGDATFIVSYIFAGGQIPSCLGQADADGGGDINVADVAYLVKYIFSDGDDPVCPLTVQ